MSDARRILMKLYTKISIGLVLGAVAGIAANILAVRTGTTWPQTAFSALSPVGDAFINAITMIVIPLVVASLIVGVASRGDLRALGRVGGKTLGYYLITTAVAVSRAASVAGRTQPSSGLRFRTDRTT